MKRVEKDGKIFYEWESHDSNKQKIFEELFIADDVIESLMDGLLKAMGKRRAELAEGWRQIRNVTGVKNDKGLGYLWIQGEFEELNKREEL